MMIPSLQVRVGEFFATEHSREVGERDRFLSPGIISFSFYPSNKKSGFIIDSRLVSLLPTSSLVEIFQFRLK
jgi:hypothetical protein